MQSFKDFSQKEIWDMLPLSTKQRQNIIDDFIKPGHYDKICEKKMTAEDMMIKKDNPPDEDIQKLNDLKTKTL